MEMESLFHIFYVLVSFFILISINQISSQATDMSQMTAETAGLSKGLPFSIPDGSRRSTAKQFGNNSTSPCTMTIDAKYLGAFINCTKRGITNIDSDWFPSNTTTLLLNINIITLLRNGTFQKLASLRVLAIKNSSVRKIDVDALRGLHNLESLNLENNYLDLRDKVYPPGMFQYTPNLKELYIAFNLLSNSESVTDSSSDTYAEYIDIFLYLKKLEILSIDAFPVMNVGKEFANLTQLKNLTIFCAITKIVTNDSFVGLGDLQLKHFSLKYFYKPIDVFGSSAFQYLKHLDSLTVDVCNIGNHNFLATLWPFENRTMSSLYFHNVNFPQLEDSPSVTFDDGIITKEAAKHLTTICVTNFAWKESKLFAIHPAALSRGPFARCVKVVDFSNNKMGISAWKVEIFQFSLFRSVESITFTYKRAAYDPENPSGDTLMKQKLGNSVDYCPCYEGIYRNGNENTKRTKSIDDIEHYNGIEGTMEDCCKEPKTQYSFGSHLTALSESNGEIRALIPGTLRTLRIDHIFPGVARLRNMTFIIVNAENATEFYFTRNHLYIVGPGRVVGLSNLRILDVSSSVFMVDEDFFDEPIHLQTLVMQSMKPDDFFVRVPLPRILYNKHGLLHLDISDNGFNYLWPNLFFNNPLLQTLIIAKNRFTNIPFDMRLTPQLEFLDLTHNAIYILDKDERYALDSQVEKVGHFTLNIQDNAIDCACSRIDFLAWLQVTSVTLDNGGNYSCISQDGVISYTAKISDIPAFWRLCSGSLMLLWSFILASVMALVFLLAFLLMRFRFALEAFALRVFAGAFRPMTPADYKTTVFIGYADEDVLFVRYILRRYLEDDLGVTTFIHHRDLEPGYTDQQFFTAIRGSWRVLVVISEEFLQRYDLAHVVMKYASHSVTPVNQGRVFVLVEETQLYNLPDYLHGVLEDSRIIIIQDLHHQLGYEQKQKIQQCLRPA